VRTAQCGRVLDDGHWMLRRFEEKWFGRQIVPGPSKKRRRWKGYSSPFAFSSESVWPSSGKTWFLLPENTILVETEKFEISELTRSNNWISWCGVGHNNIRECLLLKNITTRVVGPISNGPTNQAIVRGSSSSHAQRGRGHTTTPAYHHLITRICERAFFCCWTTVAILFIK
jgi:hypothetical protein